jgi:hypothetical protein
MYDTKYSGKTPKKIGEQHSTKFAPDGAAPGYQRTGSSRTYGNKTAPSGPNNRHKNKTTPRGPYLNGGGDKQVSARYANKTHANFGTEGARDTLVPPMSKAPKSR